MEEEAFVHLLQSHVGQSVEVDQHFIGFLKAIEPFFYKDSAKQQLPPQARL